MNLKFAYLSSAEAGLCSPVFVIRIHRAFTNSFRGIGPGVYTLGNALEARQEIANNFFVLGSHDFLS